MKAKLFICHHPGNLLLCKNLIQIIRKYDKNTKIILFKVNHPYFLKLDFEPYKKYFDQIVEFDFIGYKKNFLKGLWEILIFQKKLKKVNTTLLANFEKIDLFLDISAYLPVNILLYNLSQQKNIKNITRFILAKPKGLQVKEDKNKIKTFLCVLYSLPFRCYKVKVLSTSKRKFFDYIDSVPGAILEIVSPISKKLDNPDYQKENILPYPVISKDWLTEKKDTVIIFGKKSIDSDLAEYLLDREFYVKRMTILFKVIADKYSGCKLYYKPHPADRGKTIPGINTRKYSLLDDSLNAQELFDRHQGRIKAVYAFSSGSVVIGSFFGIPSYTFYRYLCNQVGIKKFDNYFNQDNLKSKFLFHLADLNEIGKIDNLECPTIDSKKLEEIYRKVLYV